MLPPDRLHNILSSLPPPAYPSRSRGPQSKSSLQYKTYHPLAVRDIMSQLSEAEIGQNDELVRVIVDKLCDRTVLLAKALSFHTDARPGYFGTWTRSSRIIGPRTPLAKDTLVFDYGYDSGEEWEEEPAGDADDVVDDGEEEDGDGDEPDSDLESWLVDDDDEPAISLHDKHSPPPPLDLTVATPILKRKADDSEKKNGKKRKVVLPLTPFAKGPVWESTIGHCDYDPFKPYRIQLFNGIFLSIVPSVLISMSDVQTPRSPLIPFHMSLHASKTIKLVCGPRTRPTQTMSCLLFQLYPHDWRPPMAQTFYLACLRHHLYRRRHLLPSRHFLSAIWAFSSIKLLNFKLQVSMLLLSPLIWICESTR